MKTWSHSAAGGVSVGVLALLAAMAAASAQEVKKGTLYGNMGTVTQDLLNNAGCLDKLTPVRGTEEPQTTNAVTHGYLVGSLFLNFCINQFTTGLTSFQQPLFNPCEWQSQGRTSSLQLTGKFGDERTYHGWR